MTLIPEELSGDKAYGAGANLEILDRQTDHRLYQPEGQIQPDRVGPVYPG